MASIKRHPNGRWKARYRDDAGKEHARHFDRKVDGQRWLDSVTASMVRGDYINPADSRMTVGEWCDKWLAGYSGRPSTIRQAKTHIKTIKGTFGDARISSVRPSQVKAWTKTLAGTYAPSTVYAIYSRFSQIMGDAVHDNVIPRSPCSRRTSPKQEKRRTTMPTTEQVWAIHDAMPVHLRPAVLLGAYAGLRVAEVAALRPSDIDFMRGYVTPSIQYPAEPLKTETSRTPVPIPRELVLMLAAAVERGRGETVVTDGFGRPTTPWAIERAVRTVRTTVPGLTEGFRFHDLRHHFASTLIDSGLSVKAVQRCMRHATATTTLNVYGHLFPDADETARAAVTRVFTAALADNLRTVPANQAADLR